MLGVSDITREVDRAFLVIGVVSVVLLLGITVAMIWFSVRYRRDRTATAAQFEGNKWLELVWIGLPTIIVMWLFFVGYRGFAMMRDVPEGAMVVQVTGKQWVWTFHYPEEKLDTSEMVVPVGTPVKVELTAPANDVVHSFYIPDFRVKEDCLPGTETHLWFQAEREGNYNIFCAEFCGKDHSKMISMLRVVSPEEYDQWVYGQRLKRYKPLVFEGVTDPNHETFDELGINAEGLYKTFCMSCHGAAGDGSGLPGEARDFRTVTDKWKKTAKVVDIYRTLTAGVEGTQMRAYPNLTPWERVALGHYVRAFLTTPPPVDTEEDYAALVAEYELDKIQPPGPTIPVDRAMELLSTEDGAADAATP